MPKPSGSERFVLLDPPRKLRRSLPLNVEVCRATEIAKFVQSAPARSVFITFREEMTDALLQASLREGDRPRIKDLMTIKSPRMTTVPALLGQFRAVDGIGGEFRWLPDREFLTALTAEDAADRFLGGVSDPASETVALLRGDRRRLVLPFSSFEPSGDGVAPDFGALAFTDYGLTVAFGEYEASADAILYESDAEYRRKLHVQRREGERNFGGSLRRLRKQRRMKRGDFPGVSPKTIARIERDQVGTPHPKTLRLIAQSLGVSEDQIETY